MLFDICNNIGILQKKLKSSLPPCPKCNTITVTHCSTPNMIRKLLYDDDVTIDNQTLLSDLDMDATSFFISKVGEIIDDHKIIFSDDISASDILTICDKLALRDTIDKIFTHDNISAIPYASLIINHSLSDDALIKLYAKPHTYTYNLLYGCIHYNTFKRRYSLKHGHRIFRNATRNGLRVANIYAGDEFIDDDHIQYCTSLTTLTIHDTDRKITTCAPFAKSLKVLYIYGNIFNDEILQSCTSIVELYAGNNRGVTTCAPFANSLKVLDASHNCGIGDDGLASCHFIKNLIAYNNIKITTCEPFANSLEILKASGNCGIADIGIVSCHNIKRLHAYDNPKITTCVPFAKSLKMLSASYDCGINDNSIASCYSLECLMANNNPMITTCAPFARSLKHLFAIGVRCGITTKEVLLCKFLVKLYSDGNDKIDRSKIRLPSDNISKSGCMGHSV